MNKLGLYLWGFILLISCQDKIPPCDQSDYQPSFPSIDSLEQSLNWPADLTFSVFSDPKLTPCPACMAVAPNGDVFVGVDKMGSLGKEMNHGSIMKLVDCDGDGQIDQYTEFAKADNPRGILAIGDQVFVLHTRFSEETKLAENMDLVVFEDLDHDGKADGPPMVLIKDLSNPTYLRERGTDHATNGIQLGIDGWIYIAVGDFGFYNATDRSGQSLTMLGGGIVRVRPDGTEMEVYTHGLRNIYDMAIDPLMNIFTRGNTNDGGGWNIRFAHQIQSAEYGYPMLFKNFTEEIIPALVDLGGGSGTGALYLNDDRWPDTYNNQPLMADWGRSHLYRHPVIKNGASFVQEEEKFIQLPQITDVDIDAGGAMYLSAWDGAGYSGSPNKGYVIRVLPQSLTYQQFHDQNYTSSKKLVSLLESNNAKTRQFAQYQLVHQSNPKAIPSIWALVIDPDQTLKTRVAALFTYQQLIDIETGIINISKLIDDEKIAPYALRALTDRKSWVDKVNVQLFTQKLRHNNPLIQRAAIIGLGRIQDLSTATDLLSVKLPKSFESPTPGQEGPHAQPNPDIVLPHLAIQALKNMNAYDACIATLGSDKEKMAFWALRYMHEEKVVEALIQYYNTVSSVETKNLIIETLARLYFKEDEYDASWWWSTRPDTHGPYYKTVEWEQSPIIREFLLRAFKESKDPSFFEKLNYKYRLGIDEFGILVFDQPKVDNTAIDLEKLKGKKGQIGKSSIEDIMLAIDKIKGDIDNGRLIFTKQGCPTCHALDLNETQKGPFMGQVGSIMNKEQIAESILKPNASIAQGFASVQITTTKNENHLGFITKESATELEIRNIVGIATTIQKESIKERKELSSSMMPAGLANALSYQEFTDLVEFLSQQK